MGAMPIRGLMQRSALRLPKSMRFSRTCSMADINGHDEIAPPKPWGIIATVLWTLLALSISGAASVLTLAVWTGGKLPRSQDLITNGPLLSVAVLVWAAVKVEVLAWAARRRGWQAADYLGWI